MGGNTISACLNETSYFLWPLLSWKAKQEGTISKEIGGQTYGHILGGWPCIGQIAHESQLLLTTIYASIYMQGQDGNLAHHYYREPLYKSLSVEMYKDFISGRFAVVWPSMGG